MTLSPYLISLQRLALESDLYGFNVLARNTRGLLVQETLKLWLEGRAPMLDQPASPYPLERQAQTSPEGRL